MKGMRLLAAVLLAAVSRASCPTEDLKSCVAMCSAVPDLYQYCAENCVSSCQARRRLQDQVEPRAQCLATQVMTNVEEIAAFRETCQCADMLERIEHLETRLNELELQGPMGARDYQLPAFRWDSEELCAQVRLAPGDLIAERVSSENWGHDDADVFGDQVFQPGTGKYRWNLRMGGTMQIHNGCQQEQCIYWMIYGVSTTEMRGSCPNEWCTPGSTYGIATERQHSCGAESSSSAQSMSNLLEGSNECSQALQIGNDETVMLELDTDANILRYYKGAALNTESPVMSCGIRVPNQPLLAWVHLHGAGNYDTSEASRNQAELNWQLDYPRVAARSDRWAWDPETVCSEMEITNGGLRAQRRNAENWGHSEADAFSNIEFQPNTGSYDWQLRFRGHSSDHNNCGEDCVYWILYGVSRPTALTMCSDSRWCLPNIFYGTSSDASHACGGSETSGGTTVTGQLPDSPDCVGGFFVGSGDTVRMVLDTEQNTLKYFKNGSSSMSCGIYVPSETLVAFVHLHGAGNYGSSEDHRNAVELVWG